VIWILNDLATRPKDEERCEAVWDDLLDLSNTVTNTIWTTHRRLVLSFCRGTEQMAHDKTTIGDVTFDLIAGHHHLNQFVSRRLLEQMEALEVIKPPTIMDRWTRKTKQQIARRTLWDLGSTSKEFLDLTYIRGYERVKGTQGHMRKRVTPVTNTATRTSRSSIDILYVLESSSTVTSGV